MIQSEYAPLSIPGAALGQSVDLAWTFDDPLHVKVVKVIEGEPVPIDRSFFTVSRLPSGNARVFFEQAIEGEHFIVRETAILQLTDISNQTSFNADVVEAVWDKHVMALQELFYGIRQSLRAPFTEQVGLLYPGADDTIAIWGNGGDLVPGPTVSRILASENTLAEIEALKDAADDAKAAAQAAAAAANASAASIDAATLVRIGDFGLGELGNPDLIEDIDDPLMPTAFMRYGAGATQGVKPVGGESGGLLHNWREWDGRVIQMAVPRDTNKVWVRFWNLTVWSPWVRYFSTADRATQPIAAAGTSDEHILTALSGKQAIDAQFAARTGTVGPIALAGKATETITVPDGVVEGELFATNVSINDTGYFQIRVLTQSEGILTTGYNSRYEALSSVTGVPLVQSTSIASTSVQNAIARFRLMGNRVHFATNGGSTSLSGGAGTGLSPVLASPMIGLVLAAGGGNFDAGEMQLVWRK